VANCRKSRPRTTGRLETNAKLCRGVAEETTWAELERLRKRVSEERLAEIYRTSSTRSRGGDPDGQPARRTGDLLGGSATLACALVPSTAHALSPGRGLFKAKKIRCASRKMDGRGARRLYRAVGHATTEPRRRRCHDRRSGAIACPIRIAIDTYRAILDVARREKAQDAATSALPRARRFKISPSSTKGGEQAASRRSRQVPPQPRGLYDRARQRDGRHRSVRDHRPRRARSRNDRRLEALCNPRAQGARRRDSAPLYERADMAAHHFVAERPALDSPTAGDKIPSSAKRRALEKPARTTPAPCGAPRGRSSSIPRRPSRAELERSQKDEAGRKLAAAYERVSTAPTRWSSAAAFGRIAALRIPTTPPTRARANMSICERPIGIVPV